MMRWQSDSVFWLVTISFITANMCQFIETSQKLNTAKNAAVSHTNNSVPGPAQPAAYVQTDGEIGASDRRQLPPGNLMGKILAAKGSSLATDLSGNGGRKIAVTVSRSPRVATGACTYTVEIEQGATVSEVGDELFPGTDITQMTGGIANENFKVFKTTVMFTICPPGAQLPNMGTVTITIEFREFTGQSAGAIVNKKWMKMKVGSKMEMEWRVNIKTTKGALGLRKWKDVKIDGTLKTSNLDTDGAELQFKISKEHQKEDALVEQVWEYRGFNTGDHFVRIDKILNEFELNPLDLFPKDGINEPVTHSIGQQKFNVWNFKIAINANKAVELAVNSLDYSERSLMLYGDKLLIIQYYNEAKEDNLEPTAALFSTAQKDTCKDEWKTGELKKVGGWTKGGEFGERAYAQCAKKCNQLRKSNEQYTAAVFEKEIGSDDCWCYKGNSPEQTTKNLDTDFKHCYLRYDTSNTAWTDLKRLTISLLGVEQAKVEYFYPTDLKSELTGLTEWAFALSTGDLNTINTPFAKKLVEKFSEKRDTDVVIPEGLNFFFTKIDKFGLNTPRPQDLTDAQDPATELIKEIKTTSTAAIKSETKPNAVPNKKSQQSVQHSNKKETTIKLEKKREKRSSSTTNNPIKMAINFVQPYTQLDTGNQQEQVKSYATIRTLGARLIGSANQIKQFAMSNLETQASGDGWPFTKPLIRSKENGYPDQLQFHSLVIDGEQACIHTNATQNIVIVKDMLTLTQFEVSMEVERKSNYHLDKKFVVMGEGRNRVFDEEINVKLELDDQSQPIITGQLNYFTIGNMTKGFGASLYGDEEGKEAKDAKAFAALERIAFKELKISVSALGGTELKFFGTAHVWDKDDVQVYGQAHIQPQQTSPVVYTTKLAIGLVGEYVPYPELMQSIYGDFDSKYPWVTMRKAAVLFHREDDLSRLSLSHPMLSNINNVVANREARALLKCPVKVWVGRCNEWSTLKIKDAMGQLPQPRHTKQSCARLCNQEFQCGGFALGTTPGKEYCSLFRPGCTKQTNGTYDFYSFTGTQRVAKIEECDKRVSYTKRASKQCPTSYLYTKVNAVCDGFSHVQTAQACMDKCTNNEVPHPSCPPSVKSAKCDLAQYNRRDKWCQLGSSESTCPLTSTRIFDTYLKQESTELADKRHPLAELPLVTYLVKVKTSSWSDSGTDSNVYIKICGANSKCPASGAYLWAGGDPFERGQTDVFTVQSDDVGDIKSIVINKDNAGSGPGWHLEWVMIDCPKTRQHMRFNFMDWIYTTPVANNSPDVDEKLDEDVGTYYVGVQTSTIDGASTDSNIKIKFYGASGTTAWIELDKSGDNFQKGNFDTFEIIGKNVGKVNKIGIRTDGKNMGSGWMPDYYTVDVMNHRQHLEFRHTNRQWIDAGTGAKAGSMSTKYYNAPIAAKSFDGSENADWISCEFGVGDGKGVTEHHLGRLANKEECVDRCINLRHQSRPGINGVTVDASTGTDCYCEEAMRGKNWPINRVWKTCTFKKGVKPRTVPTKINFRGQIGRAADCGEGDTLDPYCQLYKSKLSDIFRNVEVDGEIGRENAHMEVRNFEDERFSQELVLNRKMKIEVHSIRYDYIPGNKPAPASTSVTTEGGRQGNTGKRQETASDVAEGLGEEFEQNGDSMAFIGEVVIEVPSLALEPTDTQVVSPPVTDELEAATGVSNVKLIGKLTRSQSGEVEVQLSQSTPVMEIFQQRYLKMLPVNGFATLDKGDNQVAQIDFSTSTFWVGNGKLPSMFQTGMTVGPDQMSPLLELKSPTAFYKPDTEEYTVYGTIMDITLAGFFDAFNMGTILPEVDLLREASFDRVTEFTHSSHEQTRENRVPVKKGTFLHGHLLAKYKITPIPTGPVVVDKVTGRKEVQELARRLPTQIQIKNDGIVFGIILDVVKTSSGLVNLKRSEKNPNLGPELVVTVPSPFTNEKPTTHLIKAYVESVGFNKSVEIAITKTGPAQEPGNLTPPDPDQRAGATMVNRPRATVPMIHSFTIQDKMFRHVDATAKFESHDGMNTFTMQVTFPMTRSITTKINAEFQNLINEWNAKIKDLEDKHRRRTRDPLQMESDFQDTNTVIDDDMKRLARDMERMKQNLQNSVNVFKSGRVTQTWAKKCISEAKSSSNPIRYYDWQSSAAHYPLYGQTTATGDIFLDMEKLLDCISKTTLRKNRVRELKESYQTVKQHSEKYQALQDIFITAIKLLNDQKDKHITPVKETYRTEVGRMKNFFRTRQSQLSVSSVEIATTTLNNDVKTTLPCFTMKITYVVGDNSIAASNPFEKRICVSADFEKNIASAIFKEVVETQKLDVDRAMQLLEPKYAELKASNEELKMAIATFAEENATGVTGQLLNKRQIVMPKPLSRYNDRSGERTNLRKQGRKLSYRENKRQVKSTTAYAQVTKNFNARKENRLKKRSMREKLPKVPQLFTRNYEMEQAINRYAPWVVLNSKPEGRKQSRHSINSTMPAGSACTQLNHVIDQFSGMTYELSELVHNYGHKRHFLNESQVSILGQMDGLEKSIRKQMVKDGATNLEIKDALYWVAYTKEKTLTWKHDSTNELRDHSSKSLRQHVAQMNNRISAGLTDYIGHLLTVAGDAAKRSEVAEDTEDMMKAVAENLNKVYSSGEGTSLEQITPQVTQLEDHVRRMAKRSVPCSM